MKNGALIIGGALAGVWAYDQVANRVGWPSLWAAIFTNPTFINYAFDELWLLVVGLVLIFFSLVR